MHVRVGGRDCFVRGRMDAVIAGKVPRIIDYKYALWREGAEMAYEIQMTAYCLAVMKRLGVERAIAAGLAGCSVEDFTGDRDSPLYDLELATERVAAAAETAHRRGDFVLTARSENYLHGRQDLADTILRLQRFQEAGADVLYAPALVAIEDIRAVVSSVDRPVNVLTVPGLPSVAELAAAGVARISVGGAFAFVALGAVATAGRELLEQGTYGWMQGAGAARQVIAAAFES